MQLASALNRLFLVLLIAGGILREKKNELALYECKWLVNDSADVFAGLCLEIRLRHRWL